MKNNVYNKLNNAKNLDCDLENLLSSKDEYVIMEDSDGTIDDDYDYCYVVKTNSGEIDNINKIVDDSIKKSNSFDNKIVLNPQEEVEEILSYCNDADNIKVVNVENGNREDKQDLEEVLKIVDDSYKEEIKIDEQKDTKHEDQDLSEVLKVVDESYKEEIKIDEQKDTSQEGQDINEVLNAVDDSYKEGTNEQIATAQGDGELQGAFSEEETLNSNNLEEQPVDVASNGKGNKQEMKNKKGKIVLTDSLNENKKEELVNNMDNVKVAGIISPFAHPKKTEMGNEESIVNENEISNAVSPSSVENVGDDNLMSNSALNALCGEKVEEKQPVVETDEDKPVQQVVETKEVITKVVPVTIKQKPVNNIYNNIVPANKMNLKIIEDDGNIVCDVCGHINKKGTEMCVMCSNLLENK